jgi:hypothetical protein
MADQPAPDMRQILNAQRIISDDEMALSLVDIRAYQFGRLVERILTEHPDADLSSFRMEQSTFTFPGDRSSGQKLRVTARKGKL